MSLGLLESEILSDIAEAIRVRGGFTDRYLPEQMADAIGSIPTSMSEHVTIVSVVGGNVFDNSASVSSDVTVERDLATEYNYDDMPFTHECTAVMEE